MEQNNNSSILNKSALDNSIHYPKVSVVVPVFNTEKYITKCLTSITKQTLREIEIIIVDDGSTDGSTEIIKKFMNSDHRIILLNQQNAKQGAARNVGINHAKGEYIGFVDSDDWIDLDYFEKLYMSAKKNNSDLALATNVRIGNGLTKKRIEIKKEEFIQDLQAKIDVCNLCKDACPTNKLYKLNFLKNYGIFFPEGIHCEDKIFTTMAVFYANGITTVPDLYYYYFRNPDSTVNSRKNKKANDIYRENARKEVLEFLKSKNSNLRDKDFWAIKKRISIFGITFLIIKESFNTDRFLLFGLFNIFEKEKSNNG